MDDVTSSSGGGVTRRAEARLFEWRGVYRRAEARLFEWRGVCRREEEASFSPRELRSKGKDGRIMGGD